MQSGARKHGGRERGVCAAVGGDVDVHGEQFATGIERGAMADARGMALGGRGKIFDAVVDHLHRMAALHRQQGGMGRKHGRVIFFAAKRAAGLGLDDADFFRREIEDSEQRLVHVEGALQRSPNVTPFSALYSAMTPLFSM